MADSAGDGIHALPAREKMCAGARKLRDTYDIIPGAPICQMEFGFYCLDRWKSEGHIQGANQGDPNDELASLFGYDEPGSYGLRGLGWCEAEFSPAFEEKIIEDRGEHEVVQDAAGRHVLCFKGRRSGFMPEYLEHPVKDRKTWEMNCQWRLNPNTANRFANLNEKMAEAQDKAAQGLMMGQGLVGGYMYLRSLIGPVDLMYKLHDEPALIHDCMAAWLALADAVIAKHQQYVTLDELAFAEDICYNKGPLISPSMMREFLLPYYQQLIADVQRRQLDKGRRLNIFVDTDGYALPVIDFYREIGMNAMGPFEVAAGCDVVEIGRKYPDMILHGGIDKRVLAEGKDAIDKHLDYIMLAMKRRGGYIPTCDHGVPEEVSFENYLHYRRRMLEYA